MNHYTNKRTTKPIANQGHYYRPAMNELTVHQASEPWKLYIIRNLHSNQILLHDSSCRDLTKFSTVHRGAKRMIVHIPRKKGRKLPIFLPPLVGSMHELSYSTHIESSNHCKKSTLANTLRTVTVTFIVNGGFSTSFSGFAIVIYSNIINEKTIIIERNQFRLERSPPQVRTYNCMCIWKAEKVFPSKELSFSN